LRRQGEAVRDELRKQIPSLAALFEPARGAGTK
jgi:hypothetical protein